MRKKKVLFLSDSVTVKTGFATNSRAILKFLFKTGKYEITHLCGGTTANNPDLLRSPWRSIGTLPSNPQEIANLQKDGNVFRMASYGANAIDQAVRDVKPDVFFAVQDFWGVDFCINKIWFEKINSVIWTTLDSLPILPSALENAPKIKNYWVWSKFAEDELKRLGHANVCTVHGAIDDTKFFRLPDKERVNLRARFNIPNDAFVGIFLGRNQLRKLIPNIFEGFAMWKKQNPQIKNAFLIVHCSWQEGWDIKRLMQEHGLLEKEVLTTYVCRQCSHYQVKPFTGPELDCPHCKSPKSQITTNIQHGVKENELNEIYNLADYGLSIFTSGAQEYTSVQTKLAELPLLTSDYSSGEEFCSEDAYSFPVESSYYKEIGTNFTKASAYPSSICKQINKVYNMDIPKRREYGRKAREWAVKNFSVNNIGKILEDFIDNAPILDYDFNFENKSLKNPNFVVPEGIEDDTQYLKTIYSGILDMKVENDDSGLKHWESALAQK